MTYHSKSESCIQLDKAMEIAKNNRDGEEDKISRLPHKETNQLDNLGEEHERELQSEHNILLPGRPCFCGLDGQEDDKRVKGNRQRCKCGNM